MKSKIVYLCSACGDDFAKWNGQCPSCNEWGTLSEFKVSKNRKQSKKNISEPDDLDRWIKEIDYFNMDKNVIKYIVGNKKDLNKHREVELYQLKKFCKNKNINLS